jgi:hypothetical protein
VVSCELFLQQSEALMHKETLGSAQLMGMPHGYLKVIVATFEIVQV